jgi:predicted TIM-barrel fold metal-dependent hydrolase
VSDIRRIDVHHHYVPPRYREEAIACGHEHPDGIGQLPDWNPEAAVELMDAAGIGAALLSVSSPGVHFGNDGLAADLARHVNEAGARVASDYPGRFGLFASLPMPSVDRSLEEITHAFDQLGADGVVLLTHSRGVYLGDPSLDPVFEELDRRGAAVFIHPTSPACHEETALGYPRPMIEFLFDTTRAVTHLILSGTLKRFPNLRVIVPHCGGALPSVASRVGIMSQIIPQSSGKGIDPLAQLAELYYDLAGFVTEGTLAGLLDLVEPSQLLYGSDWPFTPTPMIAGLAERLDSLPQLTPEAKDAMLRGNALRLFPRLAAAI